MRIFKIFFAVLFLCPAIAGAIEANPGDFVKLVERDIDIASVITTSFAN